MRNLNRIGVVECINGVDVNSIFDERGIPLSKDKKMTVIKGNSYFVYKASKTQYMLGVVDGVEQWFDSVDFV